MLLVLLNTIRKSTLVIDTKVKIFDRYSNAEKIIDFRVSAFFVRPRATNNPIDKRSDAFLYGEWDPDPSLVI